MSNYSNGNDFKDILDRLLANVDDSFDKRQGSIIYDALAPAAAELAQCYIALDVYTDQTYLLTAVGENLDSRVADYGLTRNQATYAERTITVYDTNYELMDIPIGSRFSVPNSYGGYNYKVIEQLNNGVYKVECETPGSVGNEYIGELLPLTSINNLGSVTIDTPTKPGVDKETDAELRERAIIKLNQESFAGNKASYIKLVKDLDGVDDCKVFPVWNGGGTVKIAIIGANGQIPDEEFIESLQTQIDPIQNQGEGIGLAPIGHTVTVVAPDRLNVNVKATLTIESGYEIGQLQSSIEGQIKQYIKEVQEEWSENDELIIYTSKLIAAILTVSQVKNVTDLKINEQSTDLSIQLSGTNVKFPILNEVIFNEG